MHVTKVDMVFFECLPMVMHLGKLRKNGQTSKMNLVMLGFHWQLMVLIHSERLGIFTQCGAFFFINNNIPPWMSIKREHIMLTMIVPGICLN
jgi:hypothetical protein